MSNGIGRVWAVNAEGGDEGRPNGVGPVYIENADQLGSKLPEPEAGDAGKVLGVLNSDGDIGWVPDQEGMAQVQADWDQTDSSQVSYIANKPSLATVATSGSYADLSNKPTIPTVDQVYDSASANAQSGVAVASAISGKQDTISDLETIRSGAAAGATAVQPSQLATVATSGSYADLSNKPSIPAAQVQSDWNQSNDQAVDYIKNKPTIPAAQVNSDWNASSGAAEILNKPTLATVATSGSYNDLSNKPSIPAAQVQSDWNQANDQAVDFIKNKPTIPAGVVVDQVYDSTSANAQSGVAVAGAISTKQDTISDLSTIRSGAEAGATAVQPSALATVATSGSYNDLSNKPTIPAAQVNSDWNASSGVSQILNKPSLASVATSGSYNDLSNKPTIPTVDQSYSASSTNAQSGTAVANALSGINQVPSSTSADENKVLTVNSSGNAVWANAPSGTPEVFFVEQGVTTRGELYNAITAHKVIIYTIGYQYFYQLYRYSQNQATFMSFSTVTSSSNGTVGYVSTGVIYSVESGSSSVITGFDNSQTSYIPDKTDTYDATSKKAMTGVAVASAIGSVAQVPSSTSADEGKILTVNSSGSAVWDAAPATVTIGYKEV